MKARSAEAEKMDLQFQTSLGYLATAGKAVGLGVFASRAIAAGEIVEIAPVVHLRSDFEQMEIGLRRRLFDWETIASVNGISALALGYGSMYNHANPANMRYESVFEGDAIRFVATRAIDADEELTINYNSTAPISTEDIWFNVLDVIPVEGGEKA